MSNPLPLSCLRGLYTTQSPTNLEGILFKFYVWNKTQDPSLLFGWVGRQRSKAETLIKFFIVCWTAAKLFDTEMLLIAFKVEKAYIRYLGRHMSNFSYIKLLDGFFGKGQVWDRNFQFQETHTSPQYSLISDHQS